jgi:hypothetical protein
MKFDLRLVLVRVHLFADKCDRESLVSMIIYTRTLRAKWYPIITESIRQNHQFLHFAVPFLIQPEDVAGDSCG